jgi:hypothetical protein
MKVAFEDAVSYARANLWDDRNVVRKTESYLAGGWWPSTSKDQQNLRERAIAAVAEARKGPTPASSGERTGRAVFL